MIKLVQHGLTGSLKQEKGNYRRKLERKLQCNNIKEVWRGTNTIVGFKGTRSYPEDMGIANEFNLFCNMFDLVLP